MILPYDAHWRLGDRVTAALDVTCGRCRHCLAGETQLCRAMRRIGFERDGGHAEYVVVPAANLVSSSVSAATRSSPRNTRPVDSPPVRSAATRILSGATGVLSENSIRAGFVGHELAGEVVELGDGVTRGWWPAGLAVASKETQP